jgi:hypothetical protein
VRSMADGEKVAAGCVAPVRRREEGFGKCAIWQMDDIAARVESWN